jgi:hypothetical protein
MSKDGEKKDIIDTIVLVKKTKSEADRKQDLEDIRRQLEIKGKKQAAVHHDTSKEIKQLKSQVEILSEKATLEIKSKEALLNEAKTTNEILAKKIDLLNEKLLSNKEAQESKSKEVQLEEARVANDALSKRIDALNEKLVSVQKEQELRDQKYKEEAIKVESIEKSQFEQLAKSVEQRYKNEIQQLEKVLDQKIKEVEELKYNLSKERSNIVVHSDNLILSEIKQDLQSKNMLISNQMNMIISLQNQILTNSKEMRDFQSRYDILSKAEASFHNNPQDTVKQKEYVAAVEQFNEKVVYKDIPATIDYSKVFRDRLDSIYHIIMNGVVANKEKEVKEIEEKLTVYKKKSEELSSRLKQEQSTVDRKKSIDGEILHVSQTLEENIKEIEQLEGRKEEFQSYIQNIKSQLHMNMGETGKLVAISKLKEAREGLSRLESLLVSVEQDKIKKETLIKTKENVIDSESRIRYHSPELLESEHNLEQIGDEVVELKLSVKDKQKRLTLFKTRLLETHKKYLSIIKEKQNDCAKAGEKCVNPEIEKELLSMIGEAKTELETIVASFNTKESRRLELSSRLETLKNQQSQLDDLADEMEKLSKEKQELSNEIISMTSYMEKSDDLIASNEEYQAIITRHQELTDLINQTGKELEMSVTTLKNLIKVRKDYQYDPYGLKKLAEVDRNIELVRTKVDDANIRLHELQIEKSGMIRDDSLKEYAMIVENRNKINKLIEVKQNRLDEVDLLMEETDLKVNEINENYYEIERLEKLLSEDESIY